MKILYAAADNYHAKIQLERFLPNVNEQKFNLKISAYRRYLPNCKVDWVLDCLYPVAGNNKILLGNNRYLDIYVEQVKKYSPDLIISDLEPYTSFAAAQLNIQYWNVSNKIFSYSIHKIYKEYSKLYKHYNYFFKDTDTDIRLINLMSIANKNYLYSHWGDAKEVPSLIDGVEWVRPYYYTGIYSQPCQHQHVVANPENQKNIFNYLKSKEDCVVFGNNIGFDNKNIVYKKIDNQSEYQCNLFNTGIFICNGNATYIADAAYNRKKMVICLDASNKENFFNYLIYHKIYDYLLEDEIINPIEMEINPNIKFLHQHLESL